MIPNLITANILNNQNLVISNTLTIIIKIELFGEIEYPKIIETDIVLPHQHLSNIGKDIALLFNNKLYSDITLIAGNTEIYAHKVILSTRSSTWMTKFTTLKFQIMGFMKQKNYKVKNIVEDVFVEVIRFMYTDSCK